jgi:long-chain acyl-CoA synthetase
LQVEQFLENSTRLDEAKIALIDRGRRLSYGDLDRQSNRFARALVAAGVKRGDRVVVCMENSAETVVSIFATLKAGGVFAMVNPASRPEMLTRIVKDCGAVALVTDSTPLDSVPHNVHVFRAIEPLVTNPETDDSPLAKKAINLDLAALIYTSGSTGRPKGVMLTHLNMVSAATLIADYLNNTAQDIIVNVLPLSHGYGLYQVLTAFKVGASVILERGFAYPAALLNRIQEERATALPLIPTISSVLSRMNLRQWDLSSLRYITNAGDAFPTHHISRLRQLLPHAKLFSMYGLTECQRVSYLPPDQIDIRPDSVGRGLKNQEIYIVDERGNRVLPGITGELVVRGPHVMKGYWQMPEETDRVLRPGPFPWEKVLYTGDLFRMDERGYLYFVGRKDHVIKTRGEKVHPREVELVLYTLPGVKEAAVVGVPDEDLGHMIKAIVVIEEGIQLTEQDVLRHCARHLEDFKVPRSVEFRERLPKTTNGKIAKRELAEAAEAA